MQNNLYDLIEDILQDWAISVNNGMPNTKDYNHLLKLESILLERKYNRQAIKELIRRLMEKRTAGQTWKTKTGWAGWKPGEKQARYGMKSAETAQAYVAGKISDDELDSEDDTTPEEEPEKNISELTKDLYPEGKGSLQKDEGSDWEIKQEGLKYGYAEIKDKDGKTIFKAAPGNAGSMLNEIISGETAKILENNPNLSDEELVGVLIEQFGDTELFNQNSGKKVTPGLGIKSGDVPEQYQDNKALYSKVLNTVKAGRRKYTKAIKSAEALGIKNPKINQFYGHKKSLQAMEDRINEMPEGAKVYSVDENGKKYEIPRDVAVQLIQDSGGGENPSDTGTFVTDPETGNIVMHFHSDKATLGDITAQSSPAKEYKRLDATIDKLYENGSINEGIRDQLKAENEMHREVLDRTERQLKTVQKEAGQFFSKMDDSKLDNVLKNIKEDKNSDGVVTKTDKGKITEKTSSKWKDTTKKSFSPGGIRTKYLGVSENEFNNMSPEEQEREQLRAYMEFMSDSPEERAEKMGIPFDADPNRNPLFTTADEDTLLDRINNKYRKEGSPDTYGDIEQIRKNHAIREKEHYDYLNQFYAGDMPLGQYMEGNTVFEQFHLEAMNPNSKKGVHQFPGLFETNHGGVSVDGSVLREVFGVDNNEDFVAEFQFEAMEQKGSSGSMKGRTTGETRNVFLLLKDTEGKEKKRIFVGEKRLRTKTGKMGKLQTVYKWHNDTIKQFMEKGKRA